MATSSIECDNNDSATFYFNVIRMWLNPNHCCHNHCHHSRLDVAIRCFKELVRTGDKCAIKTFYTSVQPYSNTLNIQRILKHIFYTGPFSIQTQTTLLKNLARACQSITRRVTNTQDSKTYQVAAIRKNCWTIILQSLN
jgi:hypothetical protein